MLNQDEIRKYIASHGMWKRRIQDAIESGTSEWTVAQVRPDNNCDFGKWLHSMGPALQKQSECQTIKSLHAEFHVAAAAVLELALAGKKEQASAAIAIGSPFMTISSKLTQAMMNWKPAQAA